MSQGRTLTDDLLGAHAAWLARGRSGDGRLVLHDTEITRSLEGADLRYAELASVRLVGVRLSHATLDGARLDRCSLEAADLRHASLVDTRFADCDLRRAQIAGMRLERTGFLRCALGDYASQPIGKPDVRAAYAVVSPDLSLRGDGTRVGTSADVDLRWFTPPSDGLKRRVVATDANGDKLSAQVLSLHVRWIREAPGRFHEIASSQTFRQFLGDGPPKPFAEAVAATEIEALRETVAQLASAWVAPDAAQ